MTAALACRPMSIRTRLDTREEQQLRREQARVGLARLYRPSPIEREFRERLADPTLRQFGYDLFEAGARHHRGADRRCR